jgi:hypothetical protein
MTTNKKGNETMFKKNDLSVNLQYYPDNRFTVCTLFTESLIRNKPEVFLGIARLHPGEQPNQIEAYEVSLGRALDNAGFSKSYRKDFLDSWKYDYLKRHPNRPVAETKPETPQDVIRITDPETVMQMGDIYHYTDGSILTIPKSIGIKIKDMESYPSLFAYVERRIPKPAPKPVFVPAPDEYLLDGEDVMQKGDMYHFRSQYVTDDFAITDAVGKKVKVFAGYTAGHVFVTRKCPAPPPATKQCVIPDGWYRLEDDGITQEGDMYCFISYGEQSTTFVSSELNKTVKVALKNAGIGTDPCVIRRLPSDAKLIHGVWMRKLGKDEYPKKGDYWGKLENEIDYIYTSCDYSITAGDCSRNNDPFYRPLQTKGNK